MTQVDALRQLAAYAQHKGDCDVAIHRRRLIDGRWIDQPCTCGLSALLAETEPSEAVTRAKPEKDAEYWRAYASSAHDSSVQLLDDYSAAIRRAKLEMLDEVDRVIAGTDMGHTTALYVNGVNMPAVQTPMLVRSVVQQRLSALRAHLKGASR